MPAKKNTIDAITNERTAVCLFIDPEIGLQGARHRASTPRNAVSRRYQTGLFAGCVVYDYCYQAKKNYVKNRLFWSNANSAVMCLSRFITKAIRYSRPHPAKKTRERRTSCRGVSPSLFGLFTSPPCSTYFSIWWYAAVDQERETDTNKILS